ncbi:MAG: YqgE/AlgH family protein, partial [bacterium]|nr:YqgE/AlgH family protein [bacterium]
MKDFCARKLLVATPMIGDGNFERTVVLMLEHTAEGAVGLVLNRPSPLVVAELLTGWEDMPGVLFSGGPVSPESLIGLSREWPDCAESGWTRILGDVGSVNLSLGAEKLGDGPGLRLFFGYSGWEADQLEGEIEAGAWFVVDPEPGDVLT